MNELYCTFLFSDESEWELFVAKILSERDLVKKWFVIDGAFSFKGKEIGLCVKSLLSQEPRLEGLKERIVVIENSINLIDEVKIERRTFLYFIRDIMVSPKLNRRLRKEKKYFLVEKASRDLATEDILKECFPEDWILISDVDEILDTRNGRGEYIHELLSNSRAHFLRVNRLRYVFDFDNLDPQVKFCPIIRVSLLRAPEKNRISEFRFRQDGVAISPIFLVFEYSYCFPLEAIRKKLDNFAHVGPDREMFDSSFQLNHHFVHPGNNNSARIWLEIIPMKYDFHASYILENIEVLRTGNINQNYSETRKQLFPNRFQ